MQKTEMQYTTAENNNNVILYR